MKGPLSIEYPPEAADTNGHFSRDSLTRYYIACKEAADEAILASGHQIVEHNVLTLVDLQGIYLGLVRWLEEKDFPLEGGMVVSRFAHYFLDSAFQKIQSKIMARYNNAISYNDLIRRIFRKEHESIGPIGLIINVTRSVELFYAPVPLRDIKWKLQREAKRGNVDARSQLHDIQNGILHIPKGGPRNYSAYADFIQCLKRDKSVAAWKEGFFSCDVKPWGLSYFNEKGVDAHIIIRAVDACNSAEADTICIVSSDQDFLPLQQRGDRSGIDVYQADIANFNSRWQIGREIKQLGARHVEVAFDRSWPSRLVIEACGHDIFNGTPVDEKIAAGVSNSEFKSLCNIHNELNQYKLTPMYQPSGVYKVLVG